MLRHVVPIAMLAAIGCSESPGFPTGDCPPSECRFDQDCGEGMVCEFRGFECRYGVCRVDPGGEGGAGGQGGGVPDDPFSCWTDPTCDDFSYLDSCPPTCETCRGDFDACYTACSDLHLTGVLHASEFACEDLS